MKFHLRKLVTAKSGLEKSGSCGQHVKTKETHHRVLSPHISPLLVWSVNVSPDMDIV